MYEQGYECEIGRQFARPPRWPNPVPGNEVR